MGAPTQGQAFSFDVTLISQSTKDIQVNPTIAVGDFKIYQDGVLDGNLDTTPTVIDATRGLVKVPVSATETSGVSRVTVEAIDAAGAEWYGASWCFFLEVPRGEPGQGQPPTSNTTEGKIDTLYKHAINKQTNDGSFIKNYNNAGDTVDSKAPISESGGTTTIDKLVTGP